MTDTNLVTVSVQNENPVLVAKVADKLAEIFIEEDAKRELEGAQTAYDELTKSIEDLKNTIARQESEYIDEMRSSDLPLGKGRRASCRESSNPSGSVQ
ncbi:MAG: hypothetical protein IPP63_07615 [Chloracidobacterium sp.]|nr:hypothetical protein [Chloracidobacterium sp.]